MINLTIDEFLLAKAGKATKTIAGYRSVLYLFRDFTGPGSWPPTPAAIDSLSVHFGERGRGGRWFVVSWKQGATDTK